MWKQGTIWVADGRVGYDYWVKHYDEPSEDYGIDGGRISKLRIRRHGETEDLVAYERGWDKHCPDEYEVKAVYAIILAKYN
jgi:hypothetical protein